MDKKPTETEKLYSLIDNSTTELYKELEDVNETLKRLEKHLEVIARIDIERYEFEKIKILQGPKAAEKFLRNKYNKNIKEEQEHTKHVLKYSY